MSTETTIGRGVIPVSLDANALGSALKSLNATVKTKLAASGVAGGAALAAGIGAAVGGTAGLLVVGKTFEDMRNTIVKATGASGKALKGLEKSATNVAKKTPASFNDIATAIAGVNQRLGLTGRPLEEVTRRILTLSRLTGTDLKTNIAAMTRLFGDWSVPTKDQAAALDKLYRASQLTGIGVDRLSQLMVQFGSPLRQLGLSFDFTAAMFSRFEREGVNIQTALPGLRMALKNFAAAGREPAPALMETFKAIRSASSVAKANTLAFEVFGTRAGPDLAAAIREGRFDLDKLMGSLKNSEGTLDKAAESTATFSTRWEIIKHNIFIPLKPLATAMFDAITEGVTHLSENMGPVVRVLTIFNDTILGGAHLIGRHSTAAKVLVGVIAALVAITKIHNFVMGVQAAGGMLKYLKATKLVTTATKVYTAVQWLLNVAMTANPIGLVIAALAALGVGLVIAWKKSETFRKIVMGAWAGIKAAVVFYWDHWLHPIFSTLIDLVTNDLPRGFKAAKDAVVDFWHNLQDAARRPAQFVVDVVWNNGLRKVINAMPGVPDVPGVAVRFASGGPVTGGRKGRDSVLAALMPGEHVLTTEEVKRLGGQKRVLAMRKAIQSGEFGRLGDLPHFAGGGFLSSMAIARAQAFAKSQVGKPYIWGGVGPGGYDCSGFMSAITNVLLGRYPYSRVGSTSTFPWSGFLPGPGQFTIGSFRGSPGHMAGTLAGMNVESAGGVGVRVGSGARGASDSLFNQMAHLGAAGNFGSSMFGAAIDKLKDVLSKVGGWLDSLSNMGGWGGLIRQMVSGVVGGFKTWAIDKLGIGSAVKTGSKFGLFGLAGLAANLFDGGGMLRSGGIGFNRSGKPEAVLDPMQTLAFQTFAEALVRAPLMGPSGARFHTDGEWRMRVTNWHEGEAMVRWVASDEIDADGEFSGTHGRMGGPR